MREQFSERKKLSQQKTRPIAYIQRHLHSAVLLAVSCIDRMNGIDGNEMNLASQSANSGRLQNPLSFYIESCLLYTSPSPRDKRQSRMPSSA